MNDDIGWEILDRYFGGQCTPDEIEGIERWAERGPAHAEFLASARAAWEATGVVPKRFDVDAAWGTVRRRMGSPARPAVMRLLRWRSAPAPARFTLPSDRSFPYVAAAIVVLMASGALVWKAGGTRWLGGSLPKSAPAREYLTQRAQRADFHLRDGTHVLLGVASRLEVPADFGRKGRGRDVVLQGEAYFEVRHDSTSPFLVHTADAVTEDVGTAFVVRAYPGEAGAQVAVTEGRVVVHPGGGAPKGRGTLLNRGQVGKIQRGGPVAVLDVPDLGPYVGWTNGRLVFQDTPLREALPRLSRWFDLEFRLADTSLAGRHLTASLSDQPTAEVLDLLALSLGVRQERRGAVVTLYPMPEPR